METCYTKIDVAIVMVIAGFIGLFFGVVIERIFGGRIHPNQLKR